MDHAAAVSLGVVGTLLVQHLLRRSDHKKETSKQPAIQLRRPTPHPTWTPGDPLPPPFNPDQRIVVDPASTPNTELYPLMISAVVPRPIGFISTISPEGVGNLAPYSYFNVISHSPPYVVFGSSASRLRESSKKDTLYNITQTGEFVVNIISEWFIEAANHCCGNFEYGENEMEISGLTPQPSIKVKPPRVAESGVQMECKLRHTYDVKDAAGAVTCTVVIGEVVLMHVAQGVAGASPSGKLIVDPVKLRPISRLGGNTYGRTEGMFDLPRPDKEPASKQPLKYTSNPN